MITRASILIGRLGRRVFSTKETELLQEISFLEGKNQIDDLNTKIDEFKSHFVLTEDEWEGKDVEYGEEEHENSLEYFRERETIIRNQILEYDSIIDESKKELNEVMSKLYEFLIGKYYKLSATSVIKVICINSVDKHRHIISVDAIHVYGGKYSNGTINVEKDDFELRLEEVDNNRLTELSQEEFDKFVLDAIDICKETLHIAKDNTANFLAYLSSEYNEGKIDFQLRMDSENHFYIHPQGKDGETFDWFK